MNHPIHIQPPLTCGSCGALVDERQAWQRWPHHMPHSGGEYMVLLQLPDTRVQKFALWEPELGAWQLRGDDLACATWPIAWRHLPPLPEWIA